MNVGIPTLAKTAIKAYFKDKLSLNAVVELLEDKDGMRVIVKVSERHDQTVANICNLDTLQFLEDTFGKTDVDRVEFEGKREDGFYGHMGVDTPPTGYGVYRVWMKS